MEQFSIFCLSTWQIQNYSSPIIQNETGRVWLTVRDLLCLEPCSIINIISLYYTYSMRILASLDGFFLNIPQNNNRKETNTYFRFQ